MSLFPIGFSSHIYYYWIYTSYLYAYEYFDHKLSSESGKGFLKKSRSYRFMIRKAEWIIRVQWVSKPGIVLVGKEGRKWLFQIKSLKILLLGTSLVVYSKKSNRHFHLFNTLYLIFEDGNKVHPKNSKYKWAQPILNLKRSKSGSVS